MIDVSALTKALKELLIENCEHLQIPVHIYESKIFEIIDIIKYLLI